MTKRMVITLEKLVEYIGVGESALRTYLSHYTLFKYVRTRRKNTVYRNKVKETVFIVNHDSLDALKAYLEIKKISGKAKYAIKLSGIERLRKYYDENTSNDVVKNEN